MANSFENWVKTRHSSEVSFRAAGEAKPKIKKVTTNVIWIATASSPDPEARVKKTEVSVIDPAATEDGTGVEVA